MEFFQPFPENPSKIPQNDTSDSDTSDSDTLNNDLFDNYIPKDNVSNEDVGNNDADNDGSDSDSPGSDSSAGTVVGPNKPERPSKTILDMLRKATKRRSKKAALDRSIELIEGVGLKSIQPSLTNASPGSQEDKSDASTDDMKAVVEHVHEVRVFSTPSMD